MDVVQGRLVLLLLLLCSVQTDAQYAKTSYYTDTTSDCYISGFLLIRTDDVVNVNSRNPNGRASSDVLRCAIKFRPADQNAIMDMDFSYFTIADKDVTLRVEVSGAGSYTLTSASRQPAKLTAKGGMATISLSRLNLNDNDFSFGIILRVYEEKPPIVHLSLNHVNQSLTITGTEQATVILRCRATGFPKPSIRVVRVDTGQPLEMDTSHTSGQDENVQQYTLTTSARCQDATIYRCEASNSVGTTQGNVTLLVNCAPTLTEELQHLTDGSTVVFIRSETAVNVVGYPPPIPRVTFFGDRNPFTEEAGLGKATRDVLVLCKPGGYIYMTNCTISRDESTTANSGIYKVTFVNTFGEVSIAVNLAASSQKGNLTGSDGTQTFPVAAVAGGVAASVLAIIVVIIFVIVIRRRCNLHIRNCNHNGMDVLETGSFEIFCDGINQAPNMTWTVIPKGGAEQEIATCGQSTCETTPIDVINGFIALRHHTTVSVEIRSNHRSWAGATIKCMTNNVNMASCQLRVIKPATVSDCEIHANATLWASGSCRANNMYTSDRLYTCQLQETSPSGSARLLSAYFPSLDSCNNGDMCGTCEFSVYIPSPWADGNYKYAVSVTPGTQNAHTMTVEIQRPGIPSVELCPRYVMEHGDLECVCKSDRGKPYPDLSWPTISTSWVLRINNINRTQNGHSYTCRQRWGSDTKSVQYKVQVAYGPKNATILGPKYHITNGSAPLNLNCTTDDVNPSVSYTWSGATCAQSLDGNTCTFTPTLTDDKISVTCTAKNTEFDTLSATTTREIEIKYPPTLPPVISGYTNGDTLTEGQSLQLNCTVSGGNPPVTSIRLFCQNQQISNETLVTDTYSSRTVTVTVKEIVFNRESACICTANWQPLPDLYNVKPTLKLTIAAAEMSRVRSLTLNDVPGNLTVDALDNVTLRCATTGRPKPSIRVVRVDTGQPLEVDTSHTSGQDENVQQYTLTTSARCQDAAIYRCEASNDKGADQKSVKLFVNCSPRLPNEGQGLGSSANPSIISDAGFSIAAFPVPSVKEVVFLGTASAETDPSTDSGQSSTALIADCQPDGLLLYMSRCSVSVKNGATAENGIYRLSVNNAFGSVDVYVKLDLTEEESLEQSQGVPTAAIAGGVAAAVVVIIVIVTVGVIFLRKKQSSERHKEQTNADVESFEEHINAVYGMEDTSEEDPKEKPKPPIKPTAVAWRISADKRETDTLQEEEINAGYSSVSTGRNQQPTIMPSRDNLNGDESVESDEDGTYSSVDDGSRMVHADRAIQPQLSSQGAGDYATTGAEGEQGRAEGPRGDVYAVVDKTKKKQQSSDHTSPSVGAENSGTARRGPASDVYAVVDKTKKRGPTSNNTGSSPAVSAQSPSTGIIGPGGDVYAQVNKSSGRDKARGDTAQQVQGTRQPGTGNNTSQKPTVKPKPAAKPKPALRPKPSTTPAGDTANDGRDASGIGTAVERDPYEDVGLSSSPESPSSTSDAQNITTTQTTETDDEYNTLRFEDNRPLRRAEAGDAEYSHIGFI